MRAYKFRIYPSKLQEKSLNHHLWLKKNLWNMLLNKTKEKYKSEQKFLTIKEMGQLVKGAGLYSQVAQSVFRDLGKSIKAKIRASKRGEKWGFPRFKSFDKIRSVLYPQSGFSLKEKLSVSPFGEIRIKQHREMKGQIKTLSLKKEASGKWFAIFSIETEPEVSRRNEGPVVGLDLGLSTLATLSDGVKIKNPHQFRKLEEKLAEANRWLSRTKLRSKNRIKARKRVALINEKIANIRKDYLHKESNKLLSSYSKIAMEELDIPSMTSQGHGKGINDASWGLFTNYLCYKAASAGSEILFVNPKDTTKTCSSCGNKKDMPLSERTYNCSSCGLSMDRDINAAKNILTRATAGIAGSQACGEMPYTHSELSEQDVSRKQEAHGFIRG